MADIRFDSPLFTAAEAARHLGLPPETFRRWLRDQGPERLLHEVRVASEPSTPTVPFVGLVEAHVLSAFRRAGVPLQRIRPALQRLKREFGLEYVLASRRLLTDGSEVLWNVSDGVDGVTDLVVVRNDQHVFVPVVQNHLQQIVWDADGHPVRLRLPVYRPADVVVDPYRGFGRPIFETSRAPLDEVLSMFRAGDPIDAVADEYGVSREDVEAAVRATIRRAA